MPGLELRKSVPGSEPAESVALTLPAPSIESDAVRKVVRPPEIPERTAAVDENACQWPIAFMSRESFQKGEYLFKLGDRAEKLFYIVKGVISLPELKRFIRPGQVIGEMGIFS